MLAMLDALSILTRQHARITLPALLTQVTAPRRYETYITLPDRAAVPVPSKCKFTFKLNCKENDPKGIWFQPQASLIILRSRFRFQDVIVTCPEPLRNFV